MERGGGASVVGPTNSNSHSNTRPVRAASRCFYGGGNNNSSAANFSGPVRRWEKKWVHVSPSQTSATPFKTRKFFLCNAPSKSPDSPIVLRKWTPLSRPQSEDDVIVPHSRRKFRYTPITVSDEKRKGTAKGVADGDESRETYKSAERQVMDSEDIYGLLDINNDLMGARQGSNEGDLIYTRRSHLNLGLNLENKNKELQPDLNIRGFWATD